MRIDQSRNKTCTISNYGQEKFNGAMKYSFILLFRSSPDFIHIFDHIFKNNLKFDLLWNF